MINSIWNWARSFLSHQLHSNVPVHCSSILIPKRNVCCQYHADNLWHNHCLKKKTKGNFFWKFITEKISSNKMNFRTFLKGLIPSCSFGICMKSDFVFVLYASFKRTYAFLITVMKTIWNNEKNIMKKTHSKFMIFTTTTIAGPRDIKIHMLQLNCSLFKPKIKSFFCCSSL